MVLKIQVVRDAMRRTLFAALGTAILLLIGYGRDWARLVRRPRLSPPEAPPPEAPMVSILIPARNEERVIGRCVAGALAQSYPALEVLVADDGSTDKTALILESLAADARLRVLPGRQLPTGWAGKPNVCQQLGEAACGDWLLFLDADTVPQPQLVAALLAHARRHGLDMVTVFPLLELGSFWERAVLPPFQALIMAIYPVERMGRPDAPPAQVLANGQCIFVRRTAYEAIGGHGAVRAEVLEDVHLAQALRRAGYLLGGGDGRAYLRVRMYTSGREVAEGMARHAAAGVRASGGRAWWAAARLFCMTFGPPVLLGVGTLIATRGVRPVGWAIIGLGALTQVAGLTFWGALYRRIYGLSPAHAILWPLGLSTYLGIAAQAMWRVRAGRGVVWKGRTYAG
jgi:chlorobactene glucosyltransferase